MKGKRKATANPGLIGVVISEAEEGPVVKEGGGFVENRAEAEAEAEAEAGEEEQEEEEEEEEEEAEDVEEDGTQGEGQEDGAQEERPPKLAEGYFEIEAIRRKRKHKGQFQYLIKWRGWPETANTWEPLENLQSCSDVLDAFEKSLRSGKSSRKRKRKHGAPHTQPKKKQPRSSAGNTMMDVEIGLLPSTSLSNSFLAGMGTPTQFVASGIEAANNGDAHPLKISRKTDENGSLYVSKEIFERNDDNEYDPKLSELRGAASGNDANTDRSAAQFEEVRIFEANSHANGILMIDHLETVQNSRRIGSKRRKSGSVKRFKKDADLIEPGLLQSPPSDIVVCYTGTPEQTQYENQDWSNSSHKSIDENATNPPTIMKIIRPISLSASVSDNVQDVLVSFLVLRSDGKEVIVDNSFLKANHPLLLINFYEQHLKYNT